MRKGSALRQLKSFEACVAQARDQMALLLWAKSSRGAKATESEHWASRKLFVFRDDSETAVQLSSPVGLGEGESLLALPSFCLHPREKKTAPTTKPMLSACSRTNCHQPIIACMAPFSKTPVFLAIPRLWEDRTLIQEQMEEVQVWLCDWHRDRSLKAARTGF